MAVRPKGPVGLLDLWVYKFWLHLLMARPLLSNFFFVFYNLAVQLVCQLVNRVIEVLIDGICKQIGATYVHGGLSALLELFYAKDDVHVSNVVEVFFEAGELAGDISTEGVGNVNVVTGDT